MPPIDPTEFAQQVWDEANRTGNLDTLYAAAGLVALLEAATSPDMMPLEVAKAAASLLVTPLARGINKDRDAFLRFTLELSELRGRMAPDTPIH